jgi:hypothetical protein
MKTTLDTTCAQNEKSTVPLDWVLILRSQNLKIEECIQWDSGLGKQGSKSSGACISLSRFSKQGHRIT